MNRLVWLGVGVLVGYVVALFRMSYRLVNMNEEEYEQFAEMIHRARYE